MYILSIGVNSKLSFICRVCGSKSGGYEKFFLLGLTPFRPSKANGHLVGM
jgi:ribosomal protein S14